MMRFPFVLGIAGLFSIGSASAATWPEGGPDPRNAPSVADSTMIQLAQSREIDIYIDEYGREVLVDAWTGRVVGVRDPRGFDRPAVGGDRGWREPERDPYLRDDRSQRALERRERRMRELGRGMPQPRGRGVYDDDFYDDEPYYTYEREPRWNEPARPAWGEPERPRLDEQPPARTAVPDPVQRQPLPESRGSDSARLDEGSSTIDEIIIDAEPGSGGLPDPAQQPDVSLVQEDVARVQILLDRLGLSPGVIDGRMGDNVNKAIATYREMTGRGLRTYDKESIETLLAETGGDPFTTYEITSADAAGPFVASIPEDFGEKARMEHLGYTSVVEKLAERFHMDERYLTSLNPGIDFTKPGSRIVVANVKRPERQPVARIVADKSGKQIRGYGADGRLVVAYPATIGSEATPSPTGTHTVERIALDPEYTYNPRINFQQGENDRVLTIPPGPNGPVGSVWIGLSKPTYGIHGTPEPSRIGRSYSNGCIRLTNWDARELAGLVKQGVTVEFSN
ncbi:L,D-transpeptidase family protein [Chelativorans sp. ZYF759]|uniref:L,D-transpeptidase family protein n=1 Tax=Chelativorans sp. ZYF759 TaxID=2692213 RepID=UPI00145E4954|nr:L,D-transpeptidase [Chelativorans sp. ZYF759]NMG41146.1 L,D-transpeptidase family protein [Chelativorans sp. ZYF759]